MTPANLHVLTHADRTSRLRGGGTCTATGLAETVGPDTARFALLRARPGRTPVLDIAALSTATDANPAFRVRHAHARLCGVARHAAALGIEPRPAAPLGIEPRSADPVGIEPRSADAPTHLTVRELLDRVVSVGEPHRLARHLEEVAEVCARLAESALPKGDDPITDDHRTRVALCARARTVLADGLRLLGVDAPERM